MKYHLITMYGFLIFTNIERILSQASFLGGEIQGDGSWEMQRDDLVMLSNTGESV